MTFYVKPNALCFGDSLDILRKHVLSESVDLIYFEPPVSVQQNTVLSNPSEELISVTDTSWHWTDLVAQEYHALTHLSNQAVVNWVQAMQVIFNKGDYLAFLVLLANAAFDSQRVIGGNKASKYARKENPVVARPTAADARWHKTGWS